MPRREFLTGGNILRMHRGGKDAHLSPISGTGGLGLGHAGNPPGSAEKALSLGGVFSAGPKGLDQMS